MAGSSAVLTSAPGKVLLTGGYLVLDPEYRGLVFATGSRFFAISQEKAPDESESPSSSHKFQWFKLHRKHKEKSNNHIHVCVLSPQFVDGVWNYVIDTDSWTFVDQSASNPFVEHAILATAQFAKSIKSDMEFKDVHVIVRGANDFYSHPKNDEVSLPAFAPLDCLIKDVHKTGLGSSAALVTSICGSLFQYWTGLSIDPSHEEHLNTRNMIHNLAQYAHCLAQGKIGSGFDISSGVFGSQIFRRFDPSCLNIMKIQSPSSSELREALTSSSWETQSRIFPLELPPGLVLYLAEVDEGTHTPSMVSKVLQWRKEYPQQSSALYNELATTNENISTALVSLIRGPALNDSGLLMDYLINHPRHEWNFSDEALPYYDLAELLQTMTNHLYTLGKNAGVPIVPESHIPLFDALGKLPGVIGSGVPGAGGFDALWTMAVDNEQVKNKIEFVLGAFPNLNITLLSSDATIRGGVKASGMLNHQVQDVPAFCN